MKVVERGSCRGDSFGSQHTLNVEKVKPLLKIKDDEKLEEALDDFSSNGDLVTILFNSIYEDRKGFEKILKKGEGYLCFEESMVGFGDTIKEAKLQLIEAYDEEGGW